MPKKKILITGSNGLIGSELIRQLQESSNYEITGVGRQAEDRETLKIDFSEDWSKNLLPEKSDIIIHLAQSEKFRDFPESAEEVYNVNTLSTLKLLEYARNCGATKFIYASSGGIYGNSDNDFNESQTVVVNKDLGFYLSTKLSSEILVENYSGLFHSIILRFFFVYGKNQKRSMLIPRLAENVKKGNPITLHGENGITINPIHVSDAAAAIIKALELNTNDKINVAGMEKLSLKEICDCIGEKLGVKVIYQIQNEEPKNLIGDIAKMQRLLTSPKVQFKQGIDDLL